MENNCIFCSIPASAIIAQNDFAFMIADKHPLAEGHTLVIVKRHIKSFFEISDEELLSVKDLLFTRQVELSKDDESIKGYNLRVNVGPIAGQTVMHLHFHLIPRREEDGLTLIGGRP